MDPPIVLDLGSDQGTDSEPVLYLTMRQRDERRTPAPYVARVAEHVRMGQVIAKLAPAEISVGGVSEHVGLLWHDLASTARDDAAPFFDALEESLENTPARDLVVYVHGTKVDFELPVTRAAELQHFGGRRFATIAFDWPSHDNILSYVIGSDRNRARAAAHPLAQLVEWLAQHSTAERIHVLAYSAGCETATLALRELREANATLSPEELHAKLRLANVVMASGDVTVTEFLDDLAAIHDIARRVTVLVSDADGALEAAERWMGGAVRIGEENSMEALESFLESRPCPRVSLIDVSLDRDSRGFDIAGHHYWYRHSWVSADLLMLLLTDRDAGQRGLVPGPWHQVWGLPADYPQRLRSAAIDAGLPVRALTVDD